MAEPKLLDRHQLAEIYVFRRDDVSNHPAAVLKASVLRLNREPDRGRQFDAIPAGPFKDEVRRLCAANGVRLPRPGYGDRRRRPGRGSA